MGSVALLEGGQKELAITGHHVVGHNERDKIWDYNGCVHPEGVPETGKTPFI